MKFNPDGPPDIEAERIRREIYAKMTPAQKWEQVNELREIAWAVKAAAVRSNHPTWTEEQVQKEVKRIFICAVT